jgi:hypothetical protein
LRKRRGCAAAWASAVVLARRPLFWLWGSLGGKSGTWLRGLHLGRRGRGRRVRGELLDLPCEVKNLKVLLLAVLQEFAVGLNLLAQIEHRLVESRKTGRRCRDGFGRRGAGRGERALGLGQPVEATVRPTELCFDIEVLVLPIVAALAKKPNEGMRRAAIGAGYGVGCRSRGGGHGQSLAVRSSRDCLLTSIVQQILLLFPSPLSL